MHAAGALACPSRDDDGALMEPFIRPAVIGLVIFIVFNGLIMASAILVLAERKIMGFMQQRYGPYLVGPHGMLQPIADILKLVFKEELRPKGADKWLFTLAPVLSIVAAFTAFATVPFGAETTLFGLLDEPMKLGISDVNVGVLVVFAVTSMGVYGIVLAGWSSNSKYSLMGGLRASAQMISYELAYATALAAVILLAGSLSLREVVDDQAGTWFGFIPQWYVFLQPLGFLIYMIAGVAETNRAPFDFPEAEQELVAGYHTEYSSMSFAMFFLAEYINMVTVSAVATSMYLGGWLGPFLPDWLGWLWFLLKVFLILFFYVWMRWTLPRYRYDQLMEFGWKWLLPASVVNLLATAALVLWLGSQNYRCQRPRGLHLCRHQHHRLRRRRRSAEPDVQRDAADHVVRRARRPLCAARRAVHGGDADHHLRRRHHGALPLRRHAAQRRPRGSRAGAGVGARAEDPQDRRRAVGGAGD